MSHLSTSSSSPKSSHQRTPSKSTASSSTTNSMRTSRVNPKAVPLLSPLDHIAQVKPQPTSPVSPSFTPRDPLLKPVQNAPNVPIITSDAPSPGLAMPDIHALPHFEGGQVRIDSKAMNMPDINRSHFEGGAVQQSNVDMPDVNRARFETGTIQNGDAVAVAANRKTPATTSSYDAPAVSSTSLSSSDPPSNSVQPESTDSSAVHGPSPSVDSSTTNESVSEATSVSQSSSSSPPPSTTSPTTKRTPKRPKTPPSPTELFMHSILSTLASSAFTIACQHASERTTKQAADRAVKLANEIAAMKAQQAEERARKERHKTMTAQAIAEEVAKERERMEQERRKGKNGGMIEEEEKTSDDNTTNTTTATITSIPAPLSQSSNPALSLAISTERTRLSQLHSETKRRKVAQQVALKAEIESKLNEIKQQRREEREELQKKIAMAEAQKVEAKLRNDIEAMRRHEAELRVLEETNTRLKEAEAAEMAAAQTQLMTQKQHRAAEEQNWLQSQLAEIEAERLEGVRKKKEENERRKKEAERELEEAKKEEEERLKAEEKKRQDELLNAKKYDFRAEALPNSYVDMSMRVNVQMKEKDVKCFETNLIQQAFTADSGGNNNTNSSFHIPAYIEFLCLRSHKSMVSPAVWTQILNQTDRNENVVRVDDNVWLVADRFEPESVEVVQKSTNGSAASSSSSTTTLHLTFTQVLLKIEKLCHNEYLRPILIRLGAKKHDGSQIQLGEFTTNLRAMESSVIGSRAVNDPNGPVRSEELPFEIVAPPSATAAAATASTSSPVIGSCLFTHSQELIYEPYERLLEKMEAKRKKGLVGLGSGKDSTIESTNNLLKSPSSVSSSLSSSSTSGLSGLLLPKHCKLQFSLRCHGLSSVSGTGPLHTFCVLYRSGCGMEEKEEGENASKEKEKEKKHVRSRSNSDNTSSTSSQTQRSSSTLKPSSLYYHSKSWTEFLRTNLRESNESPEYAKQTFELDALKGKVKASVLVVCYGAGYLGGNAASTASSAISLDKCTVLGATIINAHQLCSSSGTIGTDKKLEYTKKSANVAGKKKSSMAAGAEDNKVLHLDMNAVDGEISLIQTDSSQSATATILSGHHHSSQPPPLHLQSSTTRHSENPNITTLTKHHRKSSKSNLPADLTSSGKSSRKNSLTHQLMLPSHPIQQTLCHDGMFLISSVCIFSPSTQLEDVDKAEAKRVKKLAKLEAKAKEEQEAMKMQEEAYMKEQERVKEEMETERREFVEALAKDNASAHDGGEDDDMFGFFQVMKSPSAAAMNNAAPIAAV